MNYFLPIFPFEPPLIHFVAVFRVLTSVLAISTSSKPPLLVKPLADLKTSFKSPLSLLRFSKERNLDFFFFNHSMYDNALSTWITLVILSAWI